jgi:hypothetical protein
VARLCDRYHLVQPPAEVFSLLSQTLTDTKVLDQVNDEYLLAGLSRTVDEESLSL